MLFHISGNGASDHFGTRQLFSSRDRIEFFHTRLWQVYQYASHCFSHFNDI